MKDLSQEDRELIRRARREGREARENEEREERGLRKGAIVSSSPQGMTSWSSSIKIWACGQSYASNSQVCIILNTPYAGFLPLKAFSFSCLFLRQ